MQTQLLYYDTVDSTNSEAWRLIAQGASEGTVVIAEQQTTGRGQWSRVWQSSKGGLYLSLILEPQLPACRAGQITLWSVWGIVKFLQQAFPPVAIKWPNDLVIDKRKLGGILTETKITERLSGHEGLISHAVIGVGINWLNEVPDTGIALGYLPTNLSNLQALANLVVNGLQYAYDVWKTEGITAILPEYLKLLGDRHIIWQQQPGTVIDITAAGELVVSWHNSSKVSTFPPGAISLGYSG